MLILSLLLAPALGFGPLVANGRAAALRVAALPDGKVNLCIAGRPLPDPVAQSEGDAGQSVSQRRKAAWPLLHELAAVDQWRGQMHYVSGEEGMTPTPLLLAGTMRVAIRDDGRCALTSSVVFPGGAERVVCMVGQLGCEAGATVRLEKQGGGGPISLLISEHISAGHPTPTPNRTPTPTPTPTPDHTPNPNPNPIP
jgi:hypothetical protein